MQVAQPNTSFAHPSCFINYTYICPVLHLTQSYPELQTPSEDHLCTSCLCSGTDPIPIYQFGQTNTNFCCKLQHSLDKAWIMEPIFQSDNK